MLFFILITGSGLWGVRVFQPEMLLVLAMYFPFFFVFFFSNSLRVNGAMRFSGQSENVSRLIGGLANSGGLILIIIIQYVVFWWTGTKFTGQQIG